MILEYLIGIGFPLILIAISGHVIWKSTDSFETAADYLGRKMSRGVKGATINAVASSMPEFLTTMFFLFYIKDEGEFVDSFSGGLGVVAGSAVFNILIIPLAIIFFGGIKHSGGFKLDKNVIIRDGAFLIFSNIVLIVIIAQEELKTSHGLILVLIYFIYLSLLRKGLGLKDKSAHDEFAVSFPKLGFKFKYLLLIDLKEVILNGRTLNRSNAWFTLILSTVIMSFGTWLLVVGTKFLGEVHYGNETWIADLLHVEEFNGLGIPIIFLSVLLAAAATSIPDTMISIRDARKGNHDDSISNAIGSNIFDISFALGFPLLLYTLMHGGSLTMSNDIQVLSFGILIAMWLINIIVVFLFMLKKVPMLYKGIALSVLYVVFILFIVLDRSHDLSDIFKPFIEFLQNLN
jgi:Ca2+/Na+ antiporter